jgi:hypothetical protein
MKLISIASALAAFLLVACDDSGPGESDAVLTAEECVAEGGRVSPNPGAGAPECDDDEVQIGWVIAVEYGRCCVSDDRPTRR